MINRSFASLRMTIVIGQLDGKVEIVLLDRIQGFLQQDKRDGHVEARRKLTSPPLLQHILHNPLHMQPHDSIPPLDRFQEEAVVGVVMEEILT